MPHASLQCTAYWDCADVLHISNVLAHIGVGRMKTREWKTRDWKTRHQTAGVENAGVAQYGKPKSPLFNIVTSVLQQPLEL